MKKIFKNRKLLLIALTFFICIFVNTFLCFLVSFYSKNNSKNLYFLIPVIVLFMAVTLLLLILLIKKHSTEINTLLFSIINIFLVSILDTFIFRIISLTGSKKMVQNTGLVSVILIFVYFTMIIITSLFPLIKKEKSKKILEKKI